MECRAAGSSAAELPAVGPSVAAPSAVGAPVVGASVAGVSAAVGPVAVAPGIGEAGAVEPGVRCGPGCPPLPGHRAVGGRYQPARGGRRVRRHGERARERLPDPATAPPPGEVEPVQVGGRAHRRAHVAGEGQPDLGRGVRVRQTDLVQRHRPAQLRADRGGDQVRGGALRHHPLRHPPGHRRLVVPKRQAALCAEVVDPPGQPGVADAREGEDGAELLIGLAELLDMRHPSSHAERRRRRGIGARHFVNPA